jgi:hypothetical protein
VCGSRIISPLWLRSIGAAVVQDAESASNLILTVLQREEEGSVRAAAAEPDAAR